MKKIAPNSLAFHITMVVLIASTIALAANTAAMIVVDRRSSLSLLDHRLATLADVIGQNSTAALDFRDTHAAREVLSALRYEAPIVSGCLYDHSDALFASYRRDARTGVCSSKRQLRTASSQDLRQVSRVVLRGGEAVGTICLTSDLQTVHRRENRLITFAGGFALLSVLLGAAAGCLLQRFVTSPIFRLASAMRELTSSEHFDLRVEASGTDELRHLANGFNRMIAELERRDRLTRSAEATLQQQARCDSLTGLPNRRAFMERLSQALADGRRNGTQVALLYIDLDGFKLVNDSLGHMTGDALLKEVAARLASRVRASDTLARVGGDEFTVILPGMKSREDAGSVADSLVRSLRAPFKIHGQEVSAACSIGISVWEEGAADVHDLLRQADSAMYAAKRSGRNRAAFFSPELGLLARERLALETELRHALKRGEISVQYQPEFDVRSGQLVRFEALARWNHPTLGQVPPDKFIPIAEECGLIHSLGRWILETACAEVLRWHRMHRLPVGVAVNVSGVQFNSDAFLPQISEVLAHTGLPPQLLQIELTETVTLGSLRGCAEKLAKVRGLGVGIAIDDFGTGYSSLSYLPELPIDAVKIDRSFLRAMEVSPEGLEMIGPIIELAHGMRVRVIVEGVETGEQLNMIRALGADEAQGFLLGKPGRNPDGVIARQQNRTQAEMMPMVQQPLLEEAVQES